MRLRVQGFTFRVPQKKRFGRLRSASIAVELKVFGASTQIAQYPIEEYGLNYIGLHIMI